MGLYDWLRLQYHLGFGFDCREDGRVPLCYIAKKSAYGINEKEDALSANKEEVVDWSKQLELLKKHTGASSLNMEYNYAGRLLTLDAATDFKKIDIVLNACLERLDRCIWICNNLKTKFNGSTDAPWSWEREEEKALIQVEELIDVLCRGKSRAHVISDCLDSGLISANYANPSNWIKGSGKKLANEFSLVLQKRNGTELNNNTLAWGHLPHFACLSRKLGLLARYFPIDQTHPECTKINATTSNSSSTRSPTALDVKSAMPLCDPKKSCNFNLSVMYSMAMIEFPVYQKSAPPIIIDDTATQDKKVIAPNSTSTNSESTPLSMEPLSSSLSSSSSSMPASSSSSSSCIPLTVTLTSSPTTTTSSLSSLEIVSMTKRSHPALIDLTQSSENADEITAKKSRMEAKLCIVCDERPVSTMVLPCQDAVACSICSDQLQQTNNAKLCIWCRGQITDVLDENK
jgi:hypothetical protein